MEEMLENIDGHKKLNEILDDDYLQCNSLVKFCLHY
jgi:hypothetical protein